jgi:hypothetical protein
MRTLYTSADQRVYELNVESAEIGANEGTSLCINVEWCSRPDLGLHEYEAIKDIEALQVRLPASQGTHLRLHKAKRALPQLAASPSLAQQRGLLLYAPPGLESITSASREANPLMKLLADYAWISWLLFQNGLSCSKRDPADFFVSSKGGVVLNWQELDKTNKGYVRHLTDMRNLIGDCLDGQSPVASRGIQWLMGLLDWPEDQDLEQAVALDVVLEAAQVLDNIEAAWTTDQRKLLAWAQTQAERDKKAAVETLSIYLLRWPDDKKVLALQQQWGDHLDSQWEWGFRKGREAVLEKRFAAAESWFRWAAGKATTPDGRLSVFHWLSTVRLVQDSGGKPADVLELVHAIEGIKDFRTMKALYHRWAPRLAHWQTPGDDPSHPYCMAWKFRFLVEFGLAVQLGKQGGKPERIYRPLRRAEQMFNILPEPWCHGLDKLVDVPPATVFSLVQQQRRIACLEALWWRQLHTRSPEDSKQCLQKLREEWTRMQEDPSPPAWFPTDEAVAAIPFDLLQRLLDLRTDTAAQGLFLGTENSQNCTASA